MNKIICWLRGMKDSFPWIDYPISGHRFIESERHSNVYIQIDECECCGKTDISWSKRPSPPQERE